MVPGLDDLYYDGIFDKNSLVLQAIVQVKPTAAIGGSHRANISVDFGMDGVIDKSVQMMIFVSTDNTSIIVKVYLYLTF